MSRVRTDLASGWEWKLADAHENAQAAKLPSLQRWRAVSQFPSVVQLELLHAKEIPDPNVGENERQIQWVGACDWAYRCSFKTPESVFANDNVDLMFEGLDTFARVTLNGREVLKSKNMFVPARVDVKKFLKTVGEANELVIVFESALRKGIELEQKLGTRESMMRDRRRMHMRKAQYSWGWDWGPIIVTCGPWLPVYLDTYSSRIDDVHVTTKVVEDHSSAEVTVDVTVAGASKSVEVEILDAKMASVAKGKLTNGSFTFTIKNPELWWLNGHGAQPLYTAEVTLLETEKPIDFLSKRFGIRTITLIQRPLDNEPGKTFLFNINGHDIFIQGGDWIPADNLLPRLTREKYYDWVRLAVRGNLNMIRVWGGGIYESEHFFDACDELGILVWHDYAFACGDFPVHDEFIENVREEAEAQTKRLRGRASLALLCGGNEDFMLADMHGEMLPGTFMTQKIYDHLDTEGPFDDSEFPQRKIYLDVIPEVIKKLCPDVQYWPSSPWGGATEANDRTVGDIHQWDVWHGKSLSYQDYKALSGRFVSEFGMHGYPDMRTVNEFAPNPEDRHPQSRAIDSHNKGHLSETRIARYLAENFRYSNELEKFAYVSQLMQSEAYGYACRDWKRLYGGKGKESCAGLIIWQFNDVYPCTSWAFVDYHLRPKPAYYAIKRSFAPISIGIERTPWSRWIDDDHPRETEIPSFSIFAHNTTARERKLSLVLKAYDMHAGKYIQLDDERRNVTLLAGSNTELGSITSDEFTEESLIVVCASLVNEAGVVEARYVNWPEPFRYLTWHKDTKVDVHVDGDRVSVVANHPVKGCLLYVGYDDGEDAEWEDNMLDLMPGEKLVVGMKGLDGRKLKHRFLNDWEL